MNLMIIQNSQIIEQIDAIHESISYIDYGHDIMRFYCNLNGDVFNFMEVLDTSSF